MILERLLDFHDATDDIVAASLKEQPVRWLLELDEDGRFLSLTESGATKKDWTELVTPYAGRSSGISPFLFVDKPDYVLSYTVGEHKLTSAKQEKEREKADNRHAAYLKLVQACMDAVDDPCIAVFGRFLNNKEEFAKAQSAAEQFSTRDKSPMKTGDLIAPRIGTQFLSDLRSVRQFWAEQQDAAADSKSSLTAECMITGRSVPIARTHPVELALGAERPKLISANENAFWSYGLQQSEIAPMSFTAARKYGEALRHLLNNDNHNLRIGGVTWVYWTCEPAGDPLFAVKEADPEEIKKLLNAPRSANADATVEPNDFYALAVSANTSRMVVRSWVTTTLAEVQANMARYFENMRLLDRDGQPRYHKHTSLAGSLVREFKDLPDQATAALLNTAIWGRPLPLSLLHQAVQRARAEREHVLTHPRAALIKLFFSSQSDSEKYAMSDQLNPNHPHPAYQCGRLLALLDNIQSEAVGARATLVDRYYGAASATPASVFGVLMRNAQNHLGKIRKTKGGLAYYFDKQIGEIAGLLDPDTGFPRTLTMEEQGLFALGFYQERNRPSSKKENENNDAPSQPGSA